MGQGLVSELFEVCSESRNARSGHPGIRAPLPWSDRPAGFPTGSRPQSHDRGSQTDEAQKRCAANIVEPGKTSNWLRNGGWFRDGAGLSSERIWMNRGAHATLPGACDTLLPLPREWLVSWGQSSIVLCKAWPCLGHRRSVFADPTAVVSALLQNVVAAHSLRLVLVAPYRAAFCHSNGSR